jgi:ribose transport system substrate-binding protein
MMKKVLTILICMAVLVSLLACNAQTPQTSAESASQSAPVAAEKKTIGLSLLTREHVYYNTLEEALLKRAEEFGYELIVQDSKQDSNLQTNQVQDFVTQKVDAIILCPVSSAGVGQAIKIAKDANIPVFTTDIRADDATGVISHIGIDNYAGGKLAAEYSNTVLGGKGEVAIIGYDEVSSCVDRSNGFIDGLKDFPGLKLVDNQNCSGNAEKGANIMQNMNLSHPDLKLAFCNGDPWALSATQIINTTKKDIKVIGFDGSPQGVEEIKKNGPFIATVWDSPAQMGTMTIDVIKDYFDGKKVEALVSYPPRMLDKDNLPSE